MVGVNPPRVGAVVIGRNEGARLRRCLESLVGRVDTLVYVDSGSDDGSQDLAADLGVDVVDLDTSVPFTAARARNAGWRHLVTADPAIAMVQFVDGDCEVRPGWMAAAVAALAEESDVAVVCGRRRERHPDRSILNRLIDLEWNTPVGEAAACGGDALVRRSALEEVAGYDDGLIAGEEPDMCLRMRRRGWRVVRLAEEMTWHDAALHHPSQWWRRTVRGGYAQAEAAWRHGSGPERHGVAGTARAVAYGLVVPSLSLAAVRASRGWSLLGMLLLGRRAVGGYRGALERGAQPGLARTYGVSMALASFPEAQGVLRFLRDLLTRRQGALIEYK